MEPLSHPTLSTNNLLNSQDPLSRTRSISLSRISSNTPPPISTLKERRKSPFQQKSETSSMKSSSTTESSSLSQIITSPTQPPSRIPWTGSQELMETTSRPGDSEPCSFSVPPQSQRKLVDQKLSQSRTPSSTGPGLEPTSPALSSSRDSTRTSKVIK